MSVSMLCLVSAHFSKAMLELVKKAPSSTQKACTVLSQEWGEGALLGAGAGATSQPETEPCPHAHLKHMEPAAPALGLSTLNPM